MVPQLLFDIVKCQIFSTLAKKADVKICCNDIIEFQRIQGAKFPGDYQVPEPWSGDIINAPILFISSNPGYSQDELYPDSTWSAPIIADFFINRFKERGSKYSWVYDNRVLNKDRTRGKKNRYWTSINKRVNELYALAGKAPAVPGIDYCITEMVHCKSFRQIGVKKALPVCTDKFMSGNTGISGAKIIVGIGSLVRKHLDSIKTINGIPVIYLPHPTASKHQSIYQNFSEIELENIKKILVNENRIEREIEYSDIGLPKEEEVRDFIDQIKKNKNRG